MRKQAGRGENSAADRDCQGPSADGGEFWHDVRREILDLPQMRAAAAVGPRPGAVARTRASVPAFGSGRLAERLPALSERLSRFAAPVRVPSPGRHDWFIATALLTFFALGWLAAMASGGA